MPTLEQLKFPIGEFVRPSTITPTIISQWIEDIRDFPHRLEEILVGLTTTQINWKYRPNGWTIKQVVHHCADSHINSIIRFKLALTEDTPTIRPYWEDRWAELSDSLEDDLSDSLLLIKGLHSKWSKLLTRLSNTELERSFVHPEHGKHFSLKENIGIYAWHCRHHLAHIQQAIHSNGSFN
ncbi:putative metal-dependent hydrolase [Aureispira anguillae]|uniref:Metal-dependent hydrolase n=2 Tax=Aureispira anguillae TaxID=2864201 RepID=A0A915YB00_9BACT|nr:putative metal-dependent hydrolase [Aureispira anguillae]